MTAPSELRPSREPATQVEIRRATVVSPELGRFLYTAAGGNWYWIDRLPWSYEQWLERLSHPRVETWVMAMGTRRVWVHTCTLDAPHALANYRARGMRVSKEHVEAVELPDVAPGPWPGAGVNGPHASLLDRS